MNSSPTARFVVRVLPVLAIGGAVAGALLQEQWGRESWLVMAWSVSWAGILGVFGYRSLRAGVLASSQQQMATTILGGLFLRLAIIVGSHFIAFKYAGSEWGGRMLFSTVGLYVLAIMVEVRTIHGEIARGQLTPEKAPGTTSVANGELANDTVNGAAGGSASR